MNLIAIRTFARQTIARRTLARRLFGFGLAFALALPVLAAPSGVVNVNEASAEELMLLPRVGPALAGRIIEHREQHGAFEQPDDLLLVRGIGEQTFKGMEAHVAVEGKTTLREKVPTRREPAATSEDDR
jgi:competence protein ComEA